MNTFFSKSRQEFFKKVAWYVCQKADITEDSLYSERKSHDVAKSRFVAWYILHTEFMMSFSEIGREFYRKPGTIMHGIKYVEKAGIGKDIMEDFKISYPQYPHP